MLWPLPQTASPACTTAAHALATSGGTQRDSKCKAEHERQDPVPDHDPEDAQHQKRDEDGYSVFSVHQVGRAPGGSGRSPGGEPWRSSDNHLVAEGHNCRPLRLPQPSYLCAPKCDPFSSGNMGLKISRILVASEGRNSHILAMRSEERRVGKECRSRWS